MTLRIYTDASMGNSPTVGLGWAFVAPDGGVHVQGTIRDVPPSCRVSAYAELLAMRKALSEVNRKHVTLSLSGGILYTDSREALHLLQYGTGKMPRTTSRERDREQEVQNLTMWLRRLASAKNITFRWVKGHSSDLLNDAADRAAVLYRRNHEFRLGVTHTEKMLSVLRAEVTESLKDARRGAVTHRGDIVNIQHHRAIGEPLCGPCKMALRQLTSEARAG